jgi:hypothetical protein
VFGRCLRLRLYAGIRIWLCICLSVLKAQSYTQIDPQTDTDFSALKPRRLYQYAGIRVCLCICLCVVEPEPRRLNQYAEIWVCLCSVCVEGPHHFEA